MSGAMAPNNAPTTSKKKTRRRKRLSALDAAHGEPRPEVSLQAQEQSHHRHRHDERCRREISPWNSVVVLQAPESDRDGVGVLIEKQYGGHDPLVPGGEKHEQCCYSEGRDGKREDDAPERLRHRAAVDQSGLVQLTWDGVEVALQVPRAE